MFRTVQSPAQRPPAALVLFLVGHDDDPKLRAALPGWAIVATDKAPKAITSTEVLAAVRKLPQVDSGVPVYLAGFSAGCSSVRALVLGGHEWAGVACFDGTHADYPTPKDYQIKPWRDFAERARRGETHAIFTCTQMGYTERLRDDKSTPAVEYPFMSTAHVLARVLDQELVPGKPLVEGNLYAEAFESKDIDKAAHIHQQNVVMPALLAQCWGPVKDSTVRALAAEIMAPFREMAGQAVDTFLGAFDLQDTKLPLRKRLANWALVEVRHQVKEEPNGSNDGPRIREYDRSPFMRKGAGGKEKPIKAPKAAWCAKAACTGLLEVAAPDEKIPTLRMSGVELQNDAKAAGTWIAAEDVHPGDDLEGFLCILNRDQPGKTGDEWARHVCIALGVVGPDGGFTTAGGNEGNAWRVTKRNLQDRTKPVDELLGFVKIGQ